ncbi:haloacid dehalogenase type II [Nocardia jiangxiensis]|uniref:Haloacid dehalogenase type II n=1 Tax=Nocardia jiangxiensis TaxID=282685 RepID=A0ABW6S9H1_9NOCA|nr:haloacid dehalogenase type II [Nocardia jiangxiensis]
MEFEPRAIKALVFDIFGTTFDWWTGVTDQLGVLIEKHGLSVDPVVVTDLWRADFFDALDAVRRGRREFALLDVLHAEGLDRVLAKIGGAVELSPDVRDAFVKTWHRLPAWPDVQDGLTRLREHYTVVALSNGGFAQTTALIKNAGLPFDCVLSAQIPRQYKPEPAVYRTAVDLLDRQPHELLMVAAHGWDLDGARAIGMRTAYVRRSREKGPHKQPEDPNSVVCDLLVNGFDELGDVLISRQGSV